jgi:hypothetical protein
MRDFFKRHAWLLGLLAGALALRLALFTGLQGNDDTIYSRIAYGLSQGDLAPRADVFWMRLGYVVPIAVLYKVLGVHVVALVLPNLAASLVLVGLAYRFGKELYGETEARLAAAFVALLPMDVFHATEAHSDLPMAALGTLSIYLLWTALRGKEGRRAGGMALSAGLILGWAHLTKESAFLFLLAALPWVRDRRAWAGLGLAAAGFAAVVAAELLLYGIALGDPFARVRTAQATQESLMGGPGGIGPRLMDLLGTLFIPLGAKFPYTGGFFWPATAGLAWVAARDRASSGWVAFWGLAVLLFIAFWPRSLVPYRPVMLLHARVLAPLAVPAALLSARFLSAALLARWPRAAWAGPPLLAAVGLFCSLRLHQDGIRQRWGIEESYTQLRSRTGQLVVTEPRSAEMLRFLSGYRPAFTAVGYTPADPPPAAGTLLLDDERRVALHEGWDGVTPPGWWRAKEPPREVLFERERGAPWRLRGPSGPPDRVILSRVAGHR